MGDKVFHCKRCGACCSWPGIVRVTTEEITKIADFLNLSKAEFVKRFIWLAPDKKGFIFVRTKDGPCIFLSESNLCIIHPVKPAQCKSFPGNWILPKEFMDQCQGEYL